MIEECTTFSVWQRKTVPTIKVHPAQDDGPNTLIPRLQEIIDNAPHFAKILVLGGTYNEQLVISKAIELCGEEDDEPVLVSRGPTITVSSDVPCFFSSLKIKTKTVATSATMTRTDPPAVSMSMGKPVFFRCEITSVYVAGNANPVIERCLIQGNGGGSGLVVRDSAGGSFLTNEITDHSLYCVEVLSKGQPKFVNNDIHTTSDDPNIHPGVGLVRISGGGAGALALAIHGEVAPTFVGNKFQDSFSDEQRNNAQVLFGTDRRRLFFASDMSSQRVGVSIEYANPVFKDNSVDGGVVAMSIVGGNGTYTSNIIQQSLLCGLYVSRGCQAKFENLKVSQHLGGGAFVDGCSPQFLSSTFMQCKGVAFSVNNSKDFTLTKCLVEKSRCGISVIGHSGGSIFENQIQRNEMFGIRLSDMGTRTKVFDNALQMNGGAGIYALNLAAPRIERNTIHSQRAGIVAATGALIYATKNHVYGNEHFAVLIQEATCGTFVQNKFANGAHAVVKVTDRSAPLFQENSIDEGTVGVLVTNKSTGRFIDNTLRGHGDAFQVSNGGDPYVEGNASTNCNRYGVFALDEGQGTFCNNTFTNMMVGVGCFKGSETLLRGNVFEKSMQAGGILGEGSKALLEKNTFNETMGNGIIMTGRRSTSRVSKCNFFHSQGYGVLSEKAAAGVVERCFFTGNITAGFGSEEEGETKFIRNRSLEDNGPGILCRNNGGGTYVLNTIEDGRSVGCRIESGARPSIRDSVIRKCHLAGVDLCQGAEGEILDCTIEHNRVGIQCGGANCKTFLGTVTVCRNNEVGMYCGIGVEVVSENCCFQDQPIGIRLTTSGPAVFQSCTIAGNEKGVVCDKQGQATLQSCTVEKCSVSGIDIQNLGHCTVKECTVDSCQNIGIYVHSKGKGHFVETKVFKCGVVGISLESQGDPKVEFCTVGECQVGVLTKDALGSFSDSTVLENISANITCRQKASTTFHKCIIAVCSQGCGVICGGDYTKFTDCQIQRNNRHGVLLEAQSHTLLRGCGVQHNVMTGIYCTPHVQATIHSCKILENHHSGMLLAIEANPTCNENEIGDNQDGGVVCMPSSKGVFNRNQLKGNSVANVRVLQKSTGHFTNNVITGGKPCGVAVQGSSAKFESNQISQHSHSGVYVVGASDAEFNGNTITQNHNGVYFERILYNMFQPPSGVDPTVCNVDEIGEANQRLRGPAMVSNNASPVWRSSNSTSVFSSSVNSATGSLQSVNSPQAAAAPLGSSARIVTNSFHSNRLSGVILLRESAALVAQNNFTDGEVGLTVMTGSKGVVEHNTFSNHRVAGIQVIGNLIDTKIRVNVFERNEIGVECKFNNRTSVALAGRGYSPTQHTLMAGFDKAVVDPAGKGEKRRERKKKREAVQNSKGTLLGAVENMFRATTSPKELGIVILDPVATDDDDDENHSHDGDTESDEASDHEGSDDSDDLGDTAEVRELPEHLRAAYIKQQKALRQGKVDTIKVSTMIMKNRFVENRAYGVFGSDGSETQIIYNTFLNELCGVSGASLAALDISENVFSSCCVGVHLSNATNFKVQRNQFTDANEIGVYASGGSGEVFNNVFCLCIVAGVCSESNGAPSVYRNLFTSNTSTELTAAIYTRRGGAGFFNDNDIHENAIGIRCDNGGLGTFSNCFIHDNTLGLSAMSGGKCTVTQCFFTQNKIADVYSTFGGAPVVNRCALNDSAKPFLVRDFGAGIFSFNVIKNVEGAAILLQFPTVAQFDTRAAELRQLKKKEADTQQILRPVLGNDGHISRAGVAFLGAMDTKAMTNTYRVAPTFSSNLISSCGAGVEVDLGDSQKDKLTKNAQTKKVTEAAAAVAKETANQNAKLKRSASTYNPVEARKNKGAVVQARYICPMPDLQTLQRGDYWAFFSQNVVHSCVNGIFVHRGPTDRPIQFKLLNEPPEDPNGMEGAKGGTYGYVVALNGPMAEGELDNGEIDAMTACVVTDDVFMCHFENNTVMNNDIGVTMKQGGNARFERNYISRCARAGILVSDEGRGEFFENVVTDCNQSYCVNVLGDATRGAVSSAIPPCYANFQQNTFCNGRTCVIVSAAEPRFVRNRVHSGEQGLYLAAACSGLFHGNVVFDNKKVGCVCMSENAFLANNFFSSPLENSAIEMKIDQANNLQANRVPAGNIIKNQFSPRLGKPEPATKISLASDHVSEQKAAKDLKELYTLLRELHESRLPTCAALGCQRCGTTVTSYDQIVEFEEMKKRAAATKLVITEEGIQHVPSSVVTQNTDTSNTLAFTTKPNIRGMNFVEQHSTSTFGGTSAASSTQHSSGAFGGTFPIVAAATISATLFKSSSAKFGKQADATLGAVAKKEAKQIVTMEDMRQHLREKREERERQKSIAFSQAQEAEAKLLKTRRKSSRRATRSRDDSDSDDDVAPKSATHRSSSTRKSSVVRVSSVGQTSSDTDSRQPSPLVKNVTHVPGIGNKSPNAVAGQSPSTTQTTAIKQSSGAQRRTSNDGRGSFAVTVPESKNSFLLDANAVARTIESPPTGDQISGAPNAVTTSTTSDSDGQNKQSKSNKVHSPRKRVGSPRVHKAQGRGNMQRQAAQGYQGAFFMDGIDLNQLVSDDDGQPRDPSVRMREGERIEGWEDNGYPSDGSQAPPTQPQASGTLQVVSFHSPVRIGGVRVKVPQRSAADRDKALDEAFGGEKKVTSAQLVTALALDLRKKHHDHPKSPRPAVADPPPVLSPHVVSAPAVTETRSANADTNKQKHQRVVVQQSAANEPQQSQSQVHTQQLGFAYPVKQTWSLTGGRQVYPGTGGVTAGGGGDELDNPVLQLPAMTQSRPNLSVAAFIPPASNTPVLRSPPRKSVSALEEMLAERDRERTIRSLRQAEADDDANRVVEDDVPPSDPDEGLSENERKTRAITRALEKGLATARNNKQSTVTAEPQNALLTSGPSLRVKRFSLFGDEDPNHIIIMAQNPTKPSAVASAAPRQKFSLRRGGSGLKPSVTYTPSPPPTRQSPMQEDDEGEPIGKLLRVSGDLDATTPRVEYDDSNLTPSSGPSPMYGYRKGTGEALPLTSPKNVPLLAVPLRSGRAVASAPAEPYDDNEDELRIAGSAVTKQSTKERSGAASAIAAALLGLKRKEGGDVDGDAPPAGVSPPPSKLVDPTGVLHQPRATSAQVHLSVMNVSPNIPGGGFVVSAKNMTIQLPTSTTRGRLPAQGYESDNEGTSSPDSGLPRRKKHQIQSPSDASQKQSRELGAQGDSDGLPREETTTPLTVSQPSLPARAVTTVGANRMASQAQSIAVLLDIGKRCLGSPVFAKEGDASALATREGSPSGRASSAAVVRTHHVVRRADYPSISPRVTSAGLAPRKQSPPAMIRVMHPTTRKQLLPPSIKSQEAANLPPLSLKQNVAAEATQLAEIPTVRRSSPSRTSPPPPAILNREPSSAHVIFGDIDPPLVPPTRRPLSSPREAHHQRGASAASRNPSSSSLVLHAGEPQLLSPNM